MKTRFAPSPSFGYLHVGGARTATLF
ncbi:glutamate--tRNA ligase family protein [Klebsiella pneumoniae]|nr:glutamate--tRNA ligase family protein [Klebsiella pneumoniae]